MIGLGPGLEPDSAFEVRLTEEEAQPWKIPWKIPTI